MIKLENINRKGNTITCDAFVEDCEEVIPLTFNVADGSMKSGALPKGYEWCTAHLRMAKRTLKKIAETNSDEKRRTIMWC